jgi:hypothetical protein
MTTVAWINTQTNICENTSLDDRPVSEIVMQGYLMLDLEAIGGGGIGHTWDGTKLIQPTPQTVEEQPTTIETETE